MAEPYSKAERDQLIGYAKDSMTFIAQEHLRWEATCKALEHQIAELKAQLEPKTRPGKLEGPDYDALSAERIMEWHRYPPGNPRGAWCDINDSYQHNCKWHPMTDIARADTVRKAIEAKGWQFRMDTYNTKNCSGAYVVVTKGEKDNEVYAMEGELSAAIVKASLRAVGAIE